MKWLSSLRRETSDDAAAPGVTADGPATVPAMQPELAGAAQTLPLAADSNSPADFATDEAAITTTWLGSPATERHETRLADEFDPGALLQQMRDELSAGQRELCEGQRALNDLFSTRFRSDEAQARAVEKLHDELRQYKTNFVRQQLLPLLKEVIFCHDFLTEQVARLAVESAGTPDPALRALASAQQMLIDLMFKYDVEPFRSEGEQFDPKCQQCTQTVAADRTEDDRTIAARGLTGFRSPEGIVRREQVTVYKFTPGAD
jgi:molecular chaperone GrpE (heat shock protein)